MSIPSTPDVLRAVREVAPAHPGLRLALLFGSVAEGRAREGSDVDLAVAGSSLDRLALSAQLAGKLGTEVDVVPLDSASIPLLEKLVQYGIVAYEGQRGCAADWRSRVLAQLETDRPWYRRMRDAWLARVAREGISGGR